MQPTIEHSAPFRRAQGEAGLPDSLGWWKLEESERQRRVEAAACNEGVLCEDGEPAPYLTREQLTITFAQLHAAGARPAADLALLGRAEATRLNRLMADAESGRHSPFTPVVHVEPLDPADHYVGEFAVTICVNGRAVTGGEFINIAAFRAFVQLMWEQRCAETPMETGVAYSTETPTELTGFAKADLDAAMATLDSLLEPATPGGDPAPLDVVAGEATLVEVLTELRTRVAGARSLVVSASEQLDWLLAMDVPDAHGVQEEAVFNAADNCPGELVDSLTTARDNLTGAPLDKAPTDDDTAAAHSEAHEPAAGHAAADGGAS